MANNKSAEKRIRVNNRNRIENRFYKSSVKTLIKGFFKELENYKILKNVESEKRLSKNLKLAYSLIDKATKKKLFHKNTAARKKARLALALKKSL